MTRKYVRKPERKAYMREYLRKWRAAHPGKMTEYVQKWRAANPERAEASRRAEYLANRQEYIDRASKWRAANPDRYKTLERDWHKANPEKNREYQLAYKFNIDVEHWAALLEAQHFCCPICDKPLATVKDTNVDHCHKTGLIRGILCAHCNRGLGQFHDDPRLLMNAIAYLAKGVIGATSPCPVSAFPSGIIAESTAY